MYYENNLDFIKNDQTPTSYGVIPIAFEVKDSDTGIALDGDQAFIRTGRAPIVRAVREFEQNNPTLSQHIFDKNGNFEDKDFVKFGYNDYVALSHLHELAPYRKALEPVANHVISDKAKLNSELPDLNIKVPNKTEALLPYLAEIYFAKASNMAQDKLEFMVDYMVKHPDAGCEKMSIMRDSFLNGETIPMIQKYIDKPNAVIDMLKYAKPYVSKEEYEVLMKATDPDTIRNLASAFEFDKMPLDVGSAVVDFSNKLNQNPELLKSMPYWYRTDGKVEIFAQLGKDHNLSAKEVEFLGKGVLNSGKPLNYNEGVAKIGAVRNININPETAWKPVAKLSETEVKKENNKDKGDMEK